MKSGQNYNHPSKNQYITTDPITKLKDISKIKALLDNHPRNLCLFTVGINTNLRISDLLRLRVGQVSHIPVGGSIGLKQMKRRKNCVRIINPASHAAIAKWLAVHPDPRHSSALFPGKDGHTPITIPYASRLIKSWCLTVGLRGNYAAHSLRKTFGYHCRVTFKKPLPVITAAFGHSSQETTLAYLGIQDDEVRELFMHEL